MQAFLRLHAAGTKAEARKQVQTQIAAAAEQQEHEGAAFEALKDAILAGIEALEVPKGQGVEVTVALEVFARPYLLEEPATELSQRNQALAPAKPKRKTKKRA